MAICFLLLSPLLASCPTQRFSQLTAPTPLVPTSSARQCTPVLIPYVRGLPKSIRGRMPRGAKSLFWGTFSPKVGFPLMAVHLFARYPQTEPVIKDGDEQFPVLHCALDIFEQHRGRLVLVNHRLIAFRPTVWSWQSIWVRAKFFGIDSAKRQPLLVFDFFTQEATPNAGEAVFISFPKGWRGGTGLQSFYFGPSGQDQIYYRMERASDGWLQITRDDGSMNIGPDAQGKDIHAILIFKWKQRRFVATPSTIQASGSLGKEDKQFMP